MLVTSDNDRKSLCRCCRVSGALHFQSSFVCMSYTVKNENFVVKLSTSRILQFFDIFMRIYRFSEILHSHASFSKTKPYTNPISPRPPSPSLTPAPYLNTISPNSSKFFARAFAPNTHRLRHSLSLRMEAYRAHSTLLSFLSRSQLLSGTQSSLCIRPARARRRRIDLPGGRARELQASVGDPCAHQPASLEPFCSI